jgi:hypothetical protein
MSRERSHTLRVCRGRFATGQVIELVIREAVSKCPKDCSLIHEAVGNIVVEVHLRKAA